MSDAPPFERRRGAGAMLAAVAASALATAWLLARAEPLALGGDNFTLTHPLLVDAYRHLRAGVLPLWTRGRWGGSPLAGDPVLGALYPPYYVGYALTPFPHVRALDLDVGMHLALLAAGIVWMLRGLGVRASAALATAALVALNPTLLYVARTWIQYWAALAYWPWLLGACARLTDRPRPGSILLAAAALAAQVYAGYPQFALYSGVVGLLWIVTRPGRSLAGRLAVATAVGVGAVGLAAPQLLPGLDMARGSVRSGPEASGTLAALDVFALPAGGWIDALRAAGPASLLPAKLAPGVLALAAVGGVGRGFAPRYLALAAIVGGWLATGPAPAMRVLHALPPFSWFAGPIKFFYLAVVLASLLAGLGLERLWRASAGVRRLAIGVLALVAVPSTPAAGLGMLALVATPRRWLGCALIAVTVAGSGTFLGASGAWRAGRLVSATASLPLLREPPPPSDDGGWLALAPDRALRQDPTNFGALWDVATFNGVGPMLQWRQAMVLEAAQPGAAAPLLRQLGVTHVLVPPGSALEGELTQAGLLPAPDVAGLHALVAPGAAPPRYLLARHARSAPADEAIALAQTGRALDDEGVVVEAPPPFRSWDGDPDGRLTVLTHRPGAARLAVAVDRPTWLVAREPYYANWSATIDGRPALAVPAGGFFLAVPVDAGTHEVVLEYREPRLRVGLAIMLLVVVIGVATTWRARSHAAA